MKIPFKKVGVLIASCALCFTLLRVLQIFFCIEPSSGFFKSGYAAIGTELSVVIFAFTLISVLFSFSERKAPAQYPKNTPLLSVGYILLSAFLVADLLFFPTTFSAPLWQIVIYFVTGAISTLLILLTGISFFVKLDFLSFLGFKNGSFPSVCTIFPLVFWIIRTIIYFSFFTEIAVISDLVFEILALISVMIFLLYVAFLKNKIEPVKAEKRMLPFFTLAFLTSVCCSLPQMLIFIFGFGYKLHSININHLTMLGISVFLAIFYFCIFKEDNLKEKTKKHIKEKTRFIN